MKFTRILAITSLVVASAVAGAGTIQAAPAPAPAQEIKYRANVVDKSVVTSLDGGIFKIAADRRTVEIADRAGNPVLRLPLSFNLASVSHPLNAVVEGAGTVLK